MNKRILTVTVGEPLEITLDQAAQTLEALECDDVPTPYFGVGFANVTQLFAVFTPQRWELLTALRKHGPMTIAALAQTIGRDDRNVSGDIATLMDWQAVEIDATGRVLVPYSAIVVDVRMPQERAA